MYGYHPHPNNSWLRRAGSANPLSVRTKIGGGEDSTVNLGAILGGILVPVFLLMIGALVGGAFTYKYICSFKNILVMFVLQDFLCITTCMWPAENSSAHRVIKNPPQSWRNGHSLVLIAALTLSTLDQMWRSVVIKESCTQLKCLEC